MNFADICCGINKLKIKQNVLEKTELDFIKSIKSNYGRSLDEDFYSDNMTRDEEINELQKDILDNLRSLKTIKSTISGDNLEQIDVLILKNHVLTQENNTQLLKFRVNTELENLVKQENDLNLDLINFEMKIEDAANNKLGMISSIKNAVEYKNEHQEIKDFATFVNTTGGHEGGWTYDDHLVFIRNYNKIKNTKKLVRVLHNILPDIPKERILSHISWYKKYLDLRLKQKQVLEKWRENKNKKPNSCKVEEESDSNKSYQTLSNSNYTTEEDEATLRAKLKKWKEEKQEKLQQELENKEKERLKNKLIQKDKELQNIEVKKQVSKWRTLKTVQEKADKLEKEIQSLKMKEKKIAITNKLIRDFQTQDNIYLIRKLNNLRLKKSNVNQSAPPPVNKKKGRRDPQRIYKTTKQWVSRINGDAQDFDERVFYGTVALKDIPKLGVPAWRTSMNE